MLPAAAAALALGASTQPPPFVLHNAAEPGTAMPAAGLGGCLPGCLDSAHSTASAKPAELWLKLGGRGFDGATSYGCDKGIGEAIKASGVPRGDVFVTSKVGPGGIDYPIGYNDTLEQAAMILQDIGSTYVDLLLVHEAYTYFPTPDHAKKAPSSDPACKVGEATYSPRECRLSTWRAMLKLQKEGKARAVGVSNWNSTHIDELEAAGLALPAVNQIPFSLQHGPAYRGCACGHSVSGCQSPTAAQREETCADLMAYFKKKSIRFQSYNSFDGGAVLKDSRLQKIADAHGASTAQVVLNWHWRHGVAVIPTTTSESYMKEDLDFVGFNLTDDDMHVLDTW